MDETLEDLVDVVDQATFFVPPAWQPWIIVALGIVGAMLLHRLVWRRVLRLVAGQSGLWARLLRRMTRPARLALVLLVLLVLANSAGLPGDVARMLSHGAAVLLITIVGWCVILGIDFFSDRATHRVDMDEEDNVDARKHVTQVRVLQRSGKIVVFLITAGLVLSTFDAVREIGVSLFASAGVAGLAIGFAARPVLANLIAGIQIALTQPIKIDDVVIVEGEWGWIEEIASTYVVVRIWDLRRLIVPLSKFIEEPFQNWTREAANIIGGITWHLDYTAPIAEMREKLREFVEASPLWDGNTVVLQVIDTTADTIEVRGLVSARNSPRAWDLRCEVREKMLDWLQAEHPGALPRQRGELRLNTDEPVRPHIPRPERDDRGISDLGHPRHGVAT